MALVQISARVRRQLGERTSDALARGVGLPTEAQCWACGGAINMLTIDPGPFGLGTVSLSVVAVGTVSVTAWGHAEHAPSRMFSGDEFEQATWAAGSHPDLMPAPVTASPELDESVIVDGRIL